MCKEKDRVVFLAVSADKVDFLEKNYTFFQCGGPS